MSVLSQKDRPVGLVLIDLMAPVPIPFMFSPRPDDVQYTHPSRGSVIQTFDGGFVDDFGEGLADIQVSGNTGWSGKIPGEARFYQLRDMIVLQYHQMRANKAKAGLPIDLVRLYWADTLHAFTYEVYPVSLTTRKNRQRPLLYQYTLRMTGLKRKFGAADLIGKAADVLTDIGSGALGSALGRIL